MVGTGGRRLSRRRLQVWGAGGGMGTERGVGGI